MIDLAKFLSRVLIVAALAPLAGCAGGNSSADSAPAAPQQSEPTPPPATAQRSTPSKRGAQAAAPASAAAPAPAAPQPSSQVTGPIVVTPEKIKADCWMKYEEDKKIKNIDQRLALVEKCVAETTRNQPPQRN